MSAEDWVRVFNLLGSIILFVGAYRAQRWTAKQAQTEETAAREPSTSSKISEAKPTRTHGPALAAPGKFERAVAEIVSRPYFDRPAYILFCLGFAISTLASIIDLSSHHTLSHLLGTARAEAGAPETHERSPAATQIPPPVATPNSSR